MGCHCLLRNNRLVGINSRITEAEEWTNELEDRMMEIIATEENEGEIKNVKKLKTA